jgi:hypothetical protein
MQVRSRWQRSVPSALRNWDTVQVAPLIANGPQLRRSPPVLKPAVQLLLGHTKIESTVRYLGIEVDDALSIAEQVDL